MEGKTFASYCSQMLSVRVSKSCFPPRSLDQYSLIHLWPWECDTNALMYGCWVFDIRTPKGGRDDGEGHLNGAKVIWEGSQFPLKSHSCPSAAADSRQVEYDLYLYINIYAYISTYIHIYIYFFFAADSPIVNMYSFLSRNSYLIWDEGWKKSHGNSLW